MEKSNRKDCYKDCLITYAISRLSENKFNGKYFITSKDGDSIEFDDGVGRRFNGEAEQYYSSEIELLDALFEKAKRLIDGIIEKKS